MELAHEISGPNDAVTVVLLHGVMNSRERHEGVLVPWLADRGLKVVNTDLRGHGRSTWADSYELDDYTLDVVELIEGQSSGPVVIVGHSMGGLVAVSVAATRPNLVTAVFLEDPALFRSGPGDAGDRIAAATATAADIREGQRIGMTEAEVVAILSDFPSSYPDRRLDQVASPEMLGAVARALLAVDPAVVEAFFRSRAFDDHERLAAIRCPMTLLRSDPNLDAHFLPEDVPLLRSIVPHAQVRLATGAAHSILLQPAGPTPYLAALDEFLVSIP